MFEKCYSLEDFKLVENNRTIAATGRFLENMSYDGKWWDIGYSEILSKLIVDTGRFAERYASDLFIDWSIIERSLADPNYKGGKYLFGIRQSGVDPASFVVNRFNQKQYYAKDYYRKVYVLLVTVDPDKNMEMKLGEASV